MEFFFPLSLALSWNPGTVSEANARLMNENDKRDLVETVELDFGFETKGS